MGLSKTVTDGLVSVALKALGDGTTQVEVYEKEVLVSVLVDKAVFGEVRVKLQDFDLANHWEVHQSVALWSHRISAHKVNEIASTLMDVGARVRLASTLVEAYMKALPGTRVSSEFAPVQI